VYGSARVSVLQRLNAIQHSALRLCSGAFRTSHVESLYVDCCEAPLELLRQLLSLQYYFRTSSYVNHPVHKHSLNPYVTRLYNARPSCVLPFQERIKGILIDLNFDNIDTLPNNIGIHPWYTPNFKVINPFKSFDKSSTSNIIYQQIFEYHKQYFKTYTPVFTDGSKSTNFVSCAYSIEENISSHRLHSKLSIFSAEAFAILKALEEMMHHNSKNFIIYTDSQSVLNSLLSINCNNPIIFKILSLITNLHSKGISLIFSWVPSHVGITGNELVDKAAKTATNYLNTGLPYPDLKIYIKDLVHSKWQNSWDTAHPNKLREIKEKISKWPQLPCRRHDVLLTRLRIGHCRLTHAHLLLGEAPPQCAYCKTIYTVAHILTSCACFKSLYIKFFGNSSPNLNSIIGETPHQGLFPFLRSTGIFYEI